MQRNLTRVSVALIWLLSGTGVRGEDGGSLVVTIEGFRNASGHARVAVFNSENGFPEDDSLAYRKVVSQIHNGQVEVRFDGLPEGIYAVSMYHDENDDAKFNKRLFGIPKEGYGVSNNITHGTRAPEFREGRFSLFNQIKEVRIRVHY